MSQIPANITDLSDDVLLLIFSNLKSWDLLNLSQTCERFSKVAADKSLWIDADLSDGVLSLQQLRRILCFLRASTRRLVLRGYKKKYARTPKFKTPLLSGHMLKLIGERCPNLTEFTLSESFVDANKLKITDFSPLQKLTNFSLIDCEFVNLPSPARDGSYFKNTHKIFPNLKSLVISKCGWVEDYDILVLSKVDTLKKLILRNLPKVGSAMAYIALSFRFGFKHLEELDMRGTSLQDNEVLSVVQNGKLRSLYLGPLGPLKRPTHDPLRGRNLIMPDPRWQEECQQVVVINVGPNGPQWRQVNDDELEGMGLQWVKNASGARQQKEREDEDRHYFIDKDGRPINDAEDGGSNDESSEENARKRPLNNTAESSAKRQKLEEVRSSFENKLSETVQKFADTVKNSKGENAGTINNSKDENSPQKTDSKDENATEKNENIPEMVKKVDCEEEIEEEVEFGPYSEDLDSDSEINCPYQPPDEFLSDAMIRAFGKNTQHLQNLIVSGCSISDQGLQQIIQLASLRVLDVTNTNVTTNGVIEARAARPDCLIIGGNTRILQHAKR